MNFTLLTAEEYLTAATKAVNAAERRVSLISMVIADHPETSSLINALKNAAKRGVTVSVAADVITYGEVTGSFLPLRYYSKGARSATGMAKDLRSAGVTFHWLGHGRMTIANGRTHSKWCVVDDTVFSFGGVNLYNEGIRNVDYMYEVVDSRLAQRLVDEHKRILKAERAASNYASVGYEINGHTVLFDGGVIGHSIIYQRVCELSKNAEKVTFVSQYCPTGKLARILKNAPATVYFNHPGRAKGFNRMLIRASMAMSGLTTSYTRKKYLHAKCMLFEMKDGSKIVITGSHNFAYTSVLLGTREVALETKDPAVIAQLESFIETYIA
jgi:cardiolipin synthase A/B